MDYVKAGLKPLSNPEVVLNLWAYADDDGYVLRIAGKAYVIDGNEDTKIALLRELSKSDFLTATSQPVPTNIAITDLKGNELSGVAHASMIHEARLHQGLFGDLMEELQRLLPNQARLVNGEHEAFRPELPERPLVVTTIILEQGDGQLIPLIQ